MFFFGVASVGRCSISFLYMMELLPVKTQVIAATLLHAHNAVISLFACIYFWFIWKNWLGIQIMAGIMGFVSCIGAFFMPESPKYLISRHLYDEAREAINRIAKFNKQNEFHGEFDREIDDKKIKKGGVNITQNESDTSILNDHEVKPNDALMSPK